MARKVIVRRHLSLPDREREALRAQIEKELRAEFENEQNELRQLLDDHEIAASLLNEGIAALRREIMRLKQRPYHNSIEENIYASTKEDHFLAGLEERGWQLEQEDNFYKRTVVYYLIDEETGNKCKSWEFIEEDIEDYPEAVERTIQSWVEKEESASRGYSP